MASARLLAVIECGMGGGGSPRILMMYHPFWDNPSM